MSTESFAVGRVLLFVSVIVSAGAVECVTNGAFECDFAADRGAVKPLWKGAFGSGHAALALREDWQTQLRRAAHDLGTQSVRFHGLFDDDMGPVAVDECSHQTCTPPTYNWTSIDTVYDFIIHKAGVNPFVELSFMPSALASGKSTYLAYGANVTPPKNLTAWGDFIFAFASHLIQRYSLPTVSRFHFEVWNEPNLSRNPFGSFWNGTQEQYFELYSVTSRALKRVHSSLRVGGPASAGGGWLEDFVAYCVNHSLPLDFISTHHYPSTTGEPDSLLADLRHDQAKLNTFRTKYGVDVPYLLTEYNSGLFNPWLLFANHDLPYAAAFVVREVLAAATDSALRSVEFLSYWTFSDVFDEIIFDTLPFHDGYGLQTVQGVAKPAYRAFQLLHRSGCPAQANHTAQTHGDRVHGATCGDVSVPVRSVAGNTSTTSPVSVHVFSNSSYAAVFVTSFYAHNDSTHKRSTGYAGPVTTKVTLLNCPASIQGAMEYRIDEAHSNPQAAWLAMGAPLSLSPEQLAQLHTASELVASPASVVCASATRGNHCNCTLSVVTHGNAVVVVDWKWS